MQKNSIIKALVKGDRYISFILLLLIKTLMHIAFSMSFVPIISYGNFIFFMLFQFPSSKEQ